MQLITTLIACFVSSALAVEIGAGAEGSNFGGLVGDILGESDNCNCGHNYRSEYQAEQAKTSDLEEKLKEEQAKTSSL
jgi:hypothetical protein